MAEFMVTSTQLKAKADSLRDCNEKFKNQITNLENQEAALITMWEGEAKEAFDKAFKNDKLQFDNFFNLITQYIQALEMIAAEYVKAENTNIGIASARTY